ncbi:Dihydropteroate synthase-like protein [Mycena maculata]|uniref:Dihydropteroate synthase-like protein n=1 Tax=Mycena maculata TaxID=230809 RepID=A0AAD7N6Y5_9AGAR|nr:Dihydropteroate synthase-like protein [Mycena maculata]
MQQPSSLQDTISINNLLLTVPLYTGAIWPKPPGQAALQPVLISLSIPHNISSTASTDDLSHTINYSLLCSILRESLNDKIHPLESLEDLSARIFDLLLLRSGLDALIPFFDQVHLKVIQSRAPLNCKAVGVASTATTSSGSSWSIGHVKQVIEDLECSTIIGVNACEREERQTVQVNISIERWDSGIQRGNWVDFRHLTRKLHEKIGTSSYQTLEALTSYIAEETLRHLWIAEPDHVQTPPLVTIKAAKPSAIIFASSSEIEIHRTYADYPYILAAEMKMGLGDPALVVHTVALALGSNIGDRFYNIELALRMLEAPQAFLESKDANAIVSVVDTSFMYESAPMYVTDQPTFINCACMIETNLAPFELLKLLKMIETTVGRVPSIRNGPRAVDLDIVLYDSVVIDTRSAPRKELDDLEGELMVPHPRLAEREFVLRPLNDMIPDFMHPLLQKSVSALLAAVPATTPPMHKVIPFPQCPLPANNTFPHTSVDVVPHTLTHWVFPSSASIQKRHRTSRHTHVMATLNTTPDSFSDGATHNTFPTALKYAEDAIAAGASILDVGGYSTRPGAAFIDAEEEIGRVGPCIAAIRAANPQLLISVDTFRPEVARAAISAGANCINDVYAFTGQGSYPFLAQIAGACMSEMKSIAREFAVPVVLMHSRGDAGSNKDYDAYGYAGPGRAVVEAVRIELGEKVDLIVKGKGGIRRWFVIVDPGVGFSKTLEGNLEVLRDAASITADLQIGSDKRRRNILSGYPQLIGASRKSFLGVILEQSAGRKTEPKERGWATAAAVACAVQQGAVVVRVHDTREMSDVVQVANALW